MILRIRSRLKYFVVNIMKQILLAWLINDSMRDSFSPLRQVEKEMAHQSVQFLFGLNQVLSIDDHFISKNP
jgi:hypothetical protein